MVRLSDQSFTVEFVFFFIIIVLYFFFFFFFQAEDGIRDGRVTGVQTCALPILRTDGSVGATISSIRSAVAEMDPSVPIYGLKTMNDIVGDSLVKPRFLSLLRSEERRVGKECRSRWWREH